MARLQRKWRATMVDVCRTRTPAPRASVGARAPALHRSDGRRGCVVAAPSPAGRGGGRRPVSRFDVDDDGGRRDGGGRQGRRRRQGWKGVVRMLNGGVDTIELWNSTASSSSRRSHGRHVTCPLDAEAMAPAGRGHVKCVVLRSIGDRPCTLTDEVAGGRTGQRSPPDAKEEYSRRTRRCAAKGSHGRAARDVTGVLLGLLVLSLPISRINFRLFWPGAAGYT